MSNNTTIEKVTPPPSVGGYETPVVTTEPDVSAQFGQARIYRDGLRAMGQGAAVLAVLLGTELKRLHAIHAPKRGAGSHKSKSRSVSSFSWPDLVGAELGFSHDTARNYMALADQAKARIPEFSEIAEELLSKPIADLPDIRRAELMERTKNLLPSASAQQLAWDWGISKPPGRRGGNTYDRDGGKGGRATLTPEQHAALLRKVCTEAGKHLAFVHHDHAYTVLTDAELEGLRNHCEAVAEAVKNWQRLDAGQRKAQIAALLQ